MSPSPTTHLQADQHGSHMQLQDAPIPTSPDHHDTTVDSAIQKPAASSANAAGTNHIGRPKYDSQLARSTLQPRNLIVGSSSPSPRWPLIRQAHTAIHRPPIVPARPSRYTGIQPIQLYSYTRYTRYTAYSTIQRPSGETLACATCNPILTGQLIIRREVCISNFSSKTQTTTSQ